MRLFNARHSLSKMHHVSYPLMNATPHVSVRPPVDDGQRVRHRLRRIGLHLIHTPSSFRSACFQKGFTSPPALISAHYRRPITALMQRIHARFTRTYIERHHHFHFALLRRSSTGTSRRFRSTTDHFFVFLPPVLEMSDKIGRAHV